MPSPSGPFGPACTTDQECQGSAGAKAVCYRGKCTCSYYQTHAYVDGQCIARTAICSAAAGLSATGSRQHCSKPNLAYVLDGAMSIQDPKLACDPVTFSCTCRPGYKWWTPDPAQKYEGRCIEEKRMCSATSFCATANGQEVSCVGGQCACDAAGYMWSAVTSSSSATNVTGMRYGTCSKPPIIYDQPSTVCPAPKVYAAFPANTNTGVYTDWGMCVASTEKCDNVLYEGANAMPRGTCLTRGNEHGSGAVTCQLNAAGMKECKCTDAGQIFNRNIFTIGTSYYNRSIQDPFGRCVDAKTVCPSYNLYPGATGCDTNCVTPVPPTTGPGSIASGYTYDRTICREFSGLPVKCVASSVVGVSSCVSESSGFKCSSPNAQLSSVSGSKVLSGVRAVKCFDCRASITTACDTEPSGAQLPIP
eukprot:TRINITY_DN1535_c0_g1_i2.p1 TRINITY_DN1535_c0_g1~~TRINITY_DN1535_c0_g1_i2.p1  ORF type:complete len:419 (+),score=62.88 TRINITY_DN1535_c0_g1_i2:1209-2465(+)